jgi:hypothetical protein
MLKEGDVQMTKVYVKINSERGLIRKFGGNRSKVFDLIHKYKTMTLPEFMMQHEHLTSQDYNTLTYEFVKK